MNKSKENSILQIITNACSSCPNVLCCIEDDCPLFRIERVVLEKEIKIKVSDNKELVEEIKQRLKENGGYCPCALIKDKDTKCPCKEFRESTKLGPCHCGMYEKVVGAQIHPEPEK